MLNVSRVKVKPPKVLPKYGTGGLHDEQQFCYELGYKDGVAATRKAIREALQQNEKNKNEKNYMLGVEK